MRGDTPTLAVVVPAHQAEAEIDGCLRALAAAGFAPADILIVDDGSRDATGERGRRHGVRVLRNEAPRGAAEARNRGAGAVAADIVFFVDADVVVHPEVRARILAAFAADPALAALIGSYDDAPPAPNVVGRYRNLLHHYVHQRGRAEASTFWTGLGAVRRDAFLRLGGFDTGWEKIEDVEFGVRLRRAGGKIRLDHGLLATHLKAWTLGSMFRTDLFGRALPWSRLVLFHGGPAHDLNLTLAHRVSVVMVGLFGIGLAAVPVAPGFALLALAALLVFVLANRDFFGFLLRREGLRFTLAALPCHALHYLAGGLGYLWVLVTEGPRYALGRRAAGARANP
jgi:GT2 family glycosyltransferase